MRKPFLVLALVVVGCGPAEGASQTKQAGPAAMSAKPDARTEAMLAAADKGRIQGDSNATIWLVEVSDFQCPYCKLWHDSTYPAIQKEFITPGIVRMAYVNYPLAQHANARPAAEAAMCAAAQGRFWPMHDRLFNSQERWAALGDASAAFDSIAKVSGVRQQEWRDCVASGAIRPLLATDHEYAMRAAVRSTPTFYIGSEAISGAAPIDEFRKAIGRARAKAAPRPRP